MKRSSFPLSLSALLFFWIASAASLDGFECEGVTPSEGDAVTLELIASDLSRPVDVTAPPGDQERVFVLEQAGRIRIIRLEDDGLLPEPFLDIQSRVACCGERGLLGLAFHPQYAANGYFFVNYSEAGSGATVVARYTVTAADPDRAEADSELRLLTIPQPAGNHNGGQVAFGPHDGYLYIGMGDGGSGCDTAGAGNNAQDPDRLLGKLLRIDVDTQDDLRNYGIPPDNPFAASDDGVRDEIWSLGLRNPWRFSFDLGAEDGTGRGDVYIADVGQGRYEEIDYRPADSMGGENYEWVAREGNHSSSVSDCTPQPLTVGEATGPVFEYPHGAGFLRGCSITGGTVYRGCRMPDLRGTYFFADHCNNWIASFSIADLIGGQPAAPRDRTGELNAGIAPDRVGSISAFGIDGRGEIYVCNLGGKLYRIVPAPAAPAFRRGDANGDGEPDISDAVFTLLFLFAGSAAPDCLDSANANGDAQVDVSDSVHLLNYLFLAGPPPQEPFAECGPAPNEDGPGCEVYPPCG